MRIVLYAVSTPHASELVETARRLGWEIAAAVRNLAGAPVPQEIEAVVDVDELDPRLLALEFAVPQTSPAARYRALADARRRGFNRAATMTDPTAVLSGSATLGDGVYVGAGSVVGAGATAGVGCLINRSCSVAHHAALADYVTTGPGVVVAGGGRIDSGAFLGAGCVLAPEIQVGAGALVGAGAVVIRDVGPGEVVVGNPARLLKRVDPVPGLPWF